MSPRVHARFTNRPASLRAAAGAKAFAGFMVAADTQKLIGAFGIDKFGSPLFTPDAGKTVESLGR